MAAPQLDTVVCRQGIVGRKHIAFGLVMLLAVSVSGCGIGPAMLNRDRFDYASAVSDSWKSQMLLNLVKIRYADSPAFLEVSSIISQYSIAAQVSGQVAWTSTPWQQAEQINGTALWYDRPTITYSLLTGEKFARSMLSPIPPAVIMSLVQSGWPVDFVFRLACDSVNGVRNRHSGQLNPRPADPQFDELLAAMRRIQDSDTIGIRVQRKDKQEADLAFFGQAAKPETEADRALVRRLLKLSPDAREYQLVFGPIPKDETEFALLSRSMLQILVELAACIDVPEEHVRQGQVGPTAQRGACMLHVCCGTCRPAASYAAIQYKGHWFWIDDGDYASKRMLSLLMLFFSLMETSTGAAAAPVITIPAG